MNGFGPQWVLGVQFIRNYCHHYDVGNARIGFSKFAVDCVAAVSTTGNLSRQQPAQLVLLSFDRRARGALNRWIAGAQFLVVAFAASCVRTCFDCKAAGDSRCSDDLLAFHGRSLDLPIPTPIPLEVTGEH